MLGNLFFTSLSCAPSATPLTSYAAAGSAASSIASRLIFRIDFTTPEAGALMVVHHAHGLHECVHDSRADELEADRKSTRLNSSHQIISYAVFCLKKKTNK